MPTAVAQKPNAKQRVVPQKKPPSRKASTNDDEDDMSGRDGVQVHQTHHSPELDLSRAHLDMAGDDDLSPPSPGSLAELETDQEATQPTAQEISTLQNQLVERDALIRSLRREMLDQTTTFEQALCRYADDNHLNVTEKHLVQLAKKTRRLNVALEKERTHNSMLRNKLKEVNANNTKLLNQQAESIEDSKTQKLEAECKALREKVAHTTQKLETTRASLQHLHTTQRSFRQILAREVGEDVDIDKVLHDQEDAGWKGRAEKIVLLKNKVKHLTQELARRGEGTNATLTNCAASAPSPRTPPSTLRKTVDQLRANVTDLQSHNDELRKRADGFAARNKTLIGQMQDIKSRMNVLLNKADADDRLINALQSEVARLKNAPKLRPRNLSPLGNLQTKTSISTQTLPLEDSVPAQSGLQNMTAEQLEASVLKAEVDHLRNLTDELYEKLYAAEQDVRRLGSQSAPKPTSEDAAEDIHLLKQALRNAQQTHKEHLRDLYRLLDQTRAVLMQR
ncbi:hypothetical protein BC832DRAFT_82107 [Gaertneriomyces semiglobifer]|nr:hypothetical protein BC832DRAFT_82107 [Gaertneriomyces semiglobifer]